MNGDRSAKTWIMAAVVVWSIVLLLAVLANGAHPGNELVAVRNHLQALPIDRRRYVRYLTLYNIPKDQREDVTTSVVYLLNSLSSSPVLSSPSNVPDSENLLVFDLRQYAPGQSDVDRWSVAWDGLVESDPYFHLRVEVLTGATRSVVAINAPWLDEGLANQLQLMTQSAGPLLRADYFVAKASTALDGAYYQFVGVPSTIKEWYKLLSIRSDSVPYAHGASLLASGVTKNPRRIIRLQGPIGALYITNDQGGEITADKDPIRNPIGSDGSVFLRDAYSEHIAIAPNGLLWFSVFGPDGRRADFAPDFVAKDDSEPGDAGILRPMISCVRCHIESGLRPFSDDFSRLMRSGADFVSLDRRILQNAAGFYDERVLQREMGIDRTRYEDALQTTVGINHGSLIQKFGAVFRRFAVDPVGGSVAAAELGTTAERLLMSLQKQNDPIIITLGTGGEAIRAAWESSFSAAAQAVWE